MEIKTINLSKNINISIENDTILNLFDLNENNESIYINLHIKKDVLLETTLLALNNLKIKKSIVINIYLESLDIKLVTKANAFVLNESNVHVELNVYSKLKNNKSKVNIEINGILDGNKSSISGCPQFFFNGNNIEAKHSLNIGAININELNYLYSKGINEKDAKYLLLSSKLFFILNKVDKKEMEIFKQKIINIWGANNA